MQQRVFFGTALALLLCLGFVAPSWAADSPGVVVFCKGITEKWEPVGASDTFETNVLSTMFKSPKPFDVMQTVISIYKDGNGQSLLHREAVDVSPKWNILYLPNIPLPSIGKFTFTLSVPAGELIASGSVTIKEKTVEKPIAKKNTVDGGTLEEIFKSFETKATNQ